MGTENIIKDLVKNDQIVKPEKGVKDFFLKKAKNSFAIAKFLFQQEELDTSMWVINAAYYSMFFAATSYLAAMGKKIKSEIGIHMHTYHALIYYGSKKIEEKILEDYRKNYENAHELLQIAYEKTNDLIDSYRFELNKRKIFTYHMGEEAEKSKAKTSLDRAQNFILLAEKLL
ncbi:MAG: hypothetical protein ACOCQ4_01560 [bacterium]